jgi:hypothetical protein
LPSLLRIIADFPETGRKLRRPIIKRAVTTGVVIII